MNGITQMRSLKHPDQLKTDNIPKTPSDRDRVRDKLKAIRWSDRASWNHIPVDVIEHEILPLLQREE